MKVTDFVGVSRGIARPATFCSPQNQSPKLASIRARSLTNQHIILMSLRIRRQHEKGVTQKYDNQRKEGAKADAMLKEKETSRQKMDSNIGSEKRMTQNDSYLRSLNEEQKQFRCCQILYLLHTILKNELALASMS